MDALPWTGGVPPLWPELRGGEAAAAAGAVVLRGIPETRDVKLLTKNYYIKDKRLDVVARGDIPKGC